MSQKKPAPAANRRSPRTTSEVAVTRVRRDAGGGLRVESASLGGYDVASGNRSFKSRPILFDGADRQLDYSSRRKLVSMGREMDRNSLLSAMLDRWTDGVVGSLINFRPTTGDAGWNQAAYELVKEKMKRCDHRGFFDAPGLTRTMLRSIGTDGEQLWTLTADDQIQAVETHQIGSPRNLLEAGHNLVDGIEVSDSGRPSGYWVSDEVYGGFISHSSKASFVSSDNAILPAYRKRISQTHGVPLAAAGLKLYERVDGYIDNEALAAEIDACLTFFIQDRSEADAPAPFMPQTGRRIEKGEDAAKVLRKIEPGLIARINANQKVEAFGAKRPGNQFTPFVEMGLTMVGATIGVPLPLALLDFKRLNYSNARTMLLQMWQTWQIWYRSVVVPCWQWVYQRWLLKEISRSRVLRARSDAFGVKWLPRRWPWVDPLKEVQALREEIAMGGGTITDHLELIGYTLEEYLAERSRELKAFALAGVPTTTIGGQPVAPTAPLIDDEANPPAEPGDEPQPQDDDEENPEP